MNLLPPAADPAPGGLTRVLDACVGRSTPGLQYVRVDGNGIRFEYAAGLAEVSGQRPMTRAHALMAYSMTKTITAIAVLQSVEAGSLALDTPLDDVLPRTAYAGHGITVRQLLDHTSGLPAPIPLRWVHLVQDSEGFNEHAAFERITHTHARLLARPGERFVYSNLGYWLLGHILERVHDRPYARLVHERIAVPLGLDERTFGFEHGVLAWPATGYLARWSMLDLIKGFVTDARFWGGHEGRWLRIRDHAPDGPAFGGLSGSASVFAAILCDQLQPESRLLGASARRLLAEPSRLSNGAAIPMTLGWHVRTSPSGTTLFKEGGGAGFHAEMRLYPERGTGSVVMSNSTTFETRRLLDRLDAVKLP